MYKAPLNERGFSILVMDIMRIEVWRMKKQKAYRFRSNTIPVSTGHSIQLLNL